MAEVLDNFKQALFYLMEETFENVRGIYLDRGTSLFETLAEISAEEASQPVSPRCASIAAQVKHVAFYLEVLSSWLRNAPGGEVDWSAAWQVVVVSDAEWQALVEELRLAYQRVLELMRRNETWEGQYEIGGALAIVAHTAYHLGEIRQALCTIKG